MPTTIGFTGGATIDVIEDCERLLELLADEPDVLDLTTRRGEVDVVHVHVPAIAWWRTSSERVRPLIEVWA